MSSQQPEAYNWKNLLNDFPIGKEVKFNKYVQEGSRGYDKYITSGKVVGFGIRIQGKNYYGGEEAPEFVRIDQVIKPPSYNYQLQEGPDGKFAIVNGYKVPLTPKVGGRRKTKSKSRKSKSHKSRKTRK